MKALKSVVSFLGWIISACLLFLFFATIITVAALIKQGMDFAQSEGTTATETDRAIAVVSLDGEIMTADDFEKRLRKQVKDENIKGIVVHIDSPGGSVGAAEEMFRAIKAADKKKPTVCALGSVAASGGLYASMGCRKIVTNKGTIGGSIGVILMMPQVSSILEKVGVGVNVVKSGKFKDTGSPLRPQTSEELELLQSTVNQAYNQFVTLIAESRGLEKDKVKSFADGRAILGETLVELGVADQIGGVDDAAHLALQMAGIQGEPEIIHPREHEGLMALLEGMQRTKLWNLLFPTATPVIQLMYL